MGHQDRCWWSTPSAAFTQWVEDIPPCHVPCQRGAVRAAAVADKQFRRMVRRLEVVRLKPYFSKTNWRDVALGASVGGGTQQEK